MNRAVCFVFSDAHLLDLEWALPVMAEFKAQAWRVEVVLVYAPHPEVHGFQMHLLENIADRIDRIDHFEPLRPPFSNWLARIPVLGRLYQSDRLLRVNGFNPFPFRLRGMIRRLAAAFRRVDAVFVGHKIRFEDCRPIAAVLTAQKRAGVPLVLFPPTADFHVAFKSILPADFTLVNVPPQAEKFRAMTDGPVAALGAPKFDTSWRRFMVAEYERWRGCRPELPAGRSPVLLILKDESSPIWDGISWADTVRGLIEQLRAPDRFLVIKPHPRQDMDSLRRLLAQLPAGDFLMDTGPIAYWSERVDAVVSLFSGGSLDPLASGKVPHLYWPISDEYRAHLDQGRAIPAMTGLYLRRNPDGSYKTQYDDFAVSIWSKEVRLSDTDPAPYVERFRATFGQDGAAARIVQACGEFLAARRREGES